MWSVKRHALLLLLLFFFFLFLLGDQVRKYCRWWTIKEEGNNKQRKKFSKRRKLHTSLICIDPTSPSPPSNSTRSDSQYSVEPSLTWKAMFFPRYLHGVLEVQKHFPFIGEFFCIKASHCRVKHNLLWRKKEKEAKA